MRGYFGGFTRGHRRGRSTKAWFHHRGIGELDATFTCASPTGKKDLIKTAGQVHSRRRAIEGALKTMSELISQWW